MSNGKQVVIVVKQKKLTKNMVLFAGDREQLVDPYFGQKLLMDTFGKFPQGLKITLEEVEVAE